jgi:hypothetical protein
MLPRMVRYKAAGEEILARVEYLHAACVTPAEVDRLIEHARWEIPGELWEEIAP